jgi:hypothetical protein
MRGQRMLRSVRNTLFSGSHVDLDIKGCFPTIASQLFDYLPIPTIKSYVEDPDKYRVMFPGLPATVVKKAVNNMLSGSGPAGAFLYGDRKPYGEIIQRTPFFQVVYREVGLMHAEMSKLYPAFCELIHRRDPDKNVPACALSFLLQDIEDTILRAMYNHLVQEYGERGMQDSILCFDGLMVNRALSPDPSTLEEAVYAETGFRVRLAVKPPGDDIYADCIPDDRPIPTKTSYSAWKEEFELRNYKLRSPLCFVHVMQDGRRDFYKRDTFLQLHEDTPGASQHLDQWLADPDKRVYEREDFYPHPLIPKPMHLNSFKGFKANTGAPVGPDDAELIRPILNHIKLLGGLSQVNYDYILDYLAQMIQYPGRLPDVALCFRSSEGVGKDGFWDKFIGGMVIGSTDHYASATHLHDIHGDKHSLRMMDKLLLVLSEASREDCKTYHKKFNDQVTKPTWSFRPLYVSEVIRNHCVRTVMFSQDEQFVVSDGNGRRVAIFDCSGVYANIPEYHDMIHKAYDDPRTAPAFYRFLAARDISGFKPSRDRPKTERSQNVAQFNVSPVMRFMVQLVHEKLAESPAGTTEIRVSWKDMIARWDSYVDEHYQGPSADTMKKRGFLKSKFTSIEHDAQYPGEDGQTMRAIVAKGKTKNYDVYEMTVAPLLRFLNKAMGDELAVVMDSHDAVLDWGPRGTPEWIKTMHAAYIEMPAVVPMEIDDGRKIDYEESVLKGVWVKKPSV